MAMTIEQANEIKQYKDNHLSLEYIINWSNEWDAIRIEVAEKLERNKEHESTSNTCNK